MMSRDVKIIRTDRYYWIISIDDKIVQLSRYRYRIDLGVVENVENILKIIEDVFMWRRTFLDVRGLINGTNLFVLLDAIYPESTIELFDNLYRKQFSTSYMNFKDFFFQVFSFTYETRYNKFPLAKKLNSIIPTVCCKIAPTNPNQKRKYNYTRPKPVIPRTVQNEAFTVTYISTVGNIATFTVNTSTLEICLSGKPYMRNPAEVMDVIISVQDVLKANDRTKLESIVEHIGSITVISIMQICYPSLAVDYFVNVCDCIVRRREPIYPQSVLRHYFKQAPYRGPARAFFYEILSILEGKTPYWYNKLVEGNQQEILSSKSSWILFYFINISSLAYYKISFIGAETLQTEIRYYLYNRSTISGKNIDTHFIYLAAYNINICIDIFYNCLDIYVDSIRSLTKIDVQLLRSYFLQNTNYNYKTINMCLSSLHYFYKFITGIDGSNPSSAFYKIQFSNGLANPTVPLSQQAKDAILRNLFTLPVVAQIGIKISCCTGLRSGSFNELMTSSLIHRGDKYILRVFLKKTCKYRIKNNLPVFNDYRIPKELGIEIEQFIADTQDLRNMLKKPYLLVYQPASRRADTKFLPVVLDGDALYYYLSKLLRGANLYTPKGLPETASLRSIRAEIGRTLFASGKNANEVSSFLGNSPMVAQTHYDNYRPIDDAKMYDKLWQETIEKGIAAHTKQKLLPQTVMYGTCNSQKECPGKDCRKCPSLIKCKEGDCTN